MDIISQSEKVLGSVIEIKLKKQDVFCFPLCFSELKRIEQTYSRFLDSSELSRLNNALGIWHPISEEFMHLIKKALDLNKKTLGAFDITVKETLDRLGYDKTYSFVEKTKKRSFKQFFSSFLRPIKVDTAKQQILLRKQIDFGGLGKGWALDQVAKILDKEGITHYYINAGGDIFAKQDGPKWEILLEHPDDPKKAIGKLTLNNQAIAASAPNRRHWGKHHHLINPQTQLPAKGVKGIFVLQEKGIDADAYATAIFTQGFEQGIELSQSLGIPILMISQDAKMYLSPEFPVELFR